MVVISTSKKTLSQSFHLDSHLPYVELLLSSRKHSSSSLLHYNLANPLHDTLKMRLKAYLVVTISELQKFAFET